MSVLMLDVWNEEIVKCHTCPRLVEWRERIAQEKRKSFSDQEYWGKPVPYFGDPDADLLIVGLAPAAHGANRTGRMFTGDRSGDWLYRALHKAGIANQSLAESRTDGLVLTGALIGAVCHCAPPDNKPLPTEVDNCSEYLGRILTAKKWRGILCLGGISWNRTHKHLGERAPKFGHAVVSHLKDTTVVASYHPSQQNTFTGRLTEPMLDEAIQLWKNAGR